MLIGLQQCQVGTCHRGGKKVPGPGYFCHTEKFDRLHGARSAASKAPIPAPIPNSAEFSTGIGGIGVGGGSQTLGPTTAPLKAE